MTTGKIKDTQIIDAHAHIAYDAIFPKTFLEKMVTRDDGSEQRQARQGTSTHMTGLGKEQILHILSRFLKDKHCDMLVKQMDRAGIRKTVLLIIDAGAHQEDVGLTIEEIYELHHRVIRKYPDRFDVFAGIHPDRTSNGLELFEKGIYRFGFKGLKLYPALGYRVDDPRLDDYYKRCARNRLPVMIHTGPSLPFLKNEYGEPGNMDVIARKYPGVDFILAHAGLRLNVPAVRSVAALPNVYLDISGFQNRFKTVDDTMIEVMGPIFREDLNKKILFGTDWPLISIMALTANAVNLLNQLFERTRHSSNEGALENILHKNASHLLRR